MGPSYWRKSKDFQFNVTQLLLEMSRGYFLMCLVFIGNKQKIQIY